MISTLCRFTYPMIESMRCMREPTQCTRCNDPAAPELRGGGYRASAPRAPAAAATTAPSSLMFARLVFSRPVSRAPDGVQSQAYREAYRKRIASESQACCKASAWPVAVGGSESEAAPPQAHERSSRPPDFESLMLQSDSMIRHSIRAKQMCIYTLHDSLHVQL
jgi:hypothetical protein